ncbi:MAG: UDP-N-acetylmuramate--L-alanine ligase [Ruminococcaceae bacterium]|nr:UDP-N-acetylmuramate--L-alanine ligase [Oscillospiraceae bacterium]
MPVYNTQFTLSRISEELKGRKSIYFIGIGGVSMSCIALMTQKLGFLVGGSDRTATNTTKMLEEHNITVNYNHFPENIISYDAIVYTVAISEDNPEYAEAKRKGIPCFSRADFLGYLMTNYNNRIGISGMHGKSTVSSMISEIFLQAGKDPTIVLGAELPSINGCYKDGGKDWFVFEACEYKDSFLSFYPTMEVILNIELDHTDYFKDLDAVKTSFKKYLNISGNKTVVLNADDKNVTEVAETFAGEKIRFSLKDAHADFYADSIAYDNGHPSFDLYFKGINQGRIKLSALGEHNIANALAASAVAYECGIDFESLKRGLLAFKGAKRRMEKKGVLNGVCYYEDYAHHPTEIEATLSCAKAIGSGNVWCIFQSHTYSRTYELYDGFINSLRKADGVILLDIYAAREINSFGVSASALADDIGEKAIYLENFRSAAEYVSKNAKHGDLVIVMGAGDVYHVFDYLTLEQE